MVIRAIGYLLRVKNPAGGARKPDSLLRPGQHRQQSAAERSLGQIRSIVWTLRADCLDRLPGSQGGAVSTTLVVTDDPANVGIVGERTGTLRRCQNIDRSSRRELRDQRRRQDDVAEEARLDDQRNAHSVDLQHREEGFLWDFN